MAGTGAAGSALGGGLPAAVAEAAAGGGGCGLGSSLIVMSGLRAPGSELAGCSSAVHAGIGLLTRHVSPPRVRHAQS